MLRAIDGFARSTDHAALTMDRSTAQQSIDRAARSMDDQAALLPPIAQRDRSIALRHDTFYKVSWLGFNGAFNTI